MGYIVCNCPACGGRLEHTGTEDFFFCEYCGTRIEKEKQIVQLSGPVTVSGIAGAETLLERAFLFLEDRDFKNADQYLERVLDADPKCAKAYIGKLMCQKQVSQMDMLASLHKPLSASAYYQKAIRFSTGEECAQYEAYDQAILDRLAEEKQALLTLIQTKESRIVQLEAYLTENKAEPTKKMAKTVLRKILLVVSILCSVFWLIGGLAVVPLFIVGIPFFLWTFFMIRWDVRAKRTTTDYEQTQMELNTARAELVEKQAQYDLWLNEIAN